MKRFGTYHTRAISDEVANSALAISDQVQYIDLSNCNAFQFTRVPGCLKSEANLSILDKGYLAPPAVASYQLPIWR